MSIEIGILIAIVGCFIGVLGYIANRDKKIINDSEWRGTVNAKLDIIIGVKEDIKQLDRRLQNHVQHADEKIQDHEGRIIKLESKNKKE